MKTIKMTWTGIRPLVMHNGQLADKKNPFVRAIKPILQKKTKMNDSDFEQVERLEWEGGLYWSNELGLVIPSDNIERCLQLGAQKSRLGKDVQAAVLCSEPEYKLVYDGPKTIEGLYKDPRFSLRKGVVVQKNRVIRVRPMIPTGWSVAFELEYDDTVVDEKGLRMAAVNAGAMIGLGDWRPKFGRFIVS